MIIVVVVVCAMINSHRLPRVVCVCVCVLVGTGKDNMCPCAYGGESREEEEAGIWIDVNNE